MARSIVIRDDAGPADIYADIAALREKQKRACIASIGDEIQADINKLLDLL